jgi:hypothetical protein
VVLFEPCPELLDGTNPFLGKIPCAFIVKFQLRKKQRGQVFILDTCTIFSIFVIFLSIFLSFLNFSLTRLHAWDTPDSPIPKYVPITFSLSPRFGGHVLNLADYF